MTVEIELRNISKQFSGHEILKDIQLNIAQGQTVGIVGGNGSGKSVLFKLICGFEVPTKGQVIIRNQVLGEQFDFPEGVGVFINEPGYIELFSGFKNLQYLAAIKNRINNKQIEEAMQLVGLNPKNKTKVKDYSLGMKQKLGIAQAIMENQHILILDEPFNALDYKTYQDVKEIIKNLKEQQKTILLTSHHFADIEELCDEIYVIEESELIPLTDNFKQQFMKK
ncbi:ABC transporter ATP-binding protein [Sutcliffiella rhizosphaerae]|uniref:Bacitracin transport ATP-binding protein BcrA n=1 Tax=Sutcliffiella rhizosphaerae TaxID=2880967 RepID=A0ABM8YT09_9BACI|nr:ABC transporter ATP-binding protein [Sutcliffiella rhizosphaerae]CAG9623097.1 Bacitracin transport ATP-binding protein BcrA [Sutcliffiella rhizosphaerae]